MIRCIFLRAMVLGSVLLLSFPATLLSQPQRRRNPAPVTRQNAALGKTLDEILALPPLFPETAPEPNADAPPRKVESDLFEEEPLPPADDAPLTELVEYWSTQNQGHQDYRSWQKPSDAVRQRLLSAIEERPWLLKELIEWLPDNAEAHDRLHRLLREDPVNDDNWQPLLKLWLMTHSRYFRDELIRLVTSPASFSRDESGFVSREPLEALAELDWEAARPILEQALASDEQSHSISALMLIYRHYLRAGETAQEEIYRARLKSMVADHQLSEFVRGIAIGALMETEWTGQQSWYVSLFANPLFSKEARRLKDLSGYDDPDLQTIPLIIPLSNNPEKWIPVVSELFENGSRQVRTVAVICLAKLAENDSVHPKFRRQAAERILPVLADFSPELESARQALAASLCVLKIPAAVAGLLAALEHDENSDMQKAAAIALAKYRDRNAAPILRKLLEKEQSQDLRSELITALVQCGGLSDAEIAEAVEAYTRKMTTAEGEREIEYFSTGEGDTEIKLPQNVLVGFVLHKSDEIALTEGAAIRLLERVKSLRHSQPETARQILRIIEFSTPEVIEQNLIERIGEAFVGTEAVRHALELRDNFQQSATSELSALLRQGGYAAGIAAIILKDDARAVEILRGNDVQARRALLVSARYVRDRLPVELVVPLLAAADKPTVIAAEKYLEADDRQEARKVILARHPGEAYILGKKVVVTSPGMNVQYEELQELEEKLRREVRKNNEEIYALLHTYAPQLNGSMMIRVRHDKATLSIYRDVGRRWMRQLTETELQELREFTSREDVENLGPERYQESPEPAYEYLRLSVSGGRRIFVDGLRRAPRSATLHEQLSGLFYRLSKTGEYKIRYDIEDTIPGVEVLLADRGQYAMTVCQEGRDLRLLLTDGNPGTSSVHMMAAQWRSFSEGKPGSVKEVSAVCQSLEMSDLPLLLTGPFSVPARVRNILYFPVRNGENSGVWKYQRGKAPVRILEGHFQGALGTPDDKWLIVVRIASENGEKSLQYLRINLQTKKEFRIPGLEGMGYFPLAFVEEHDKVLIVSFIAWESTVTNGFLLDPETGTLQPVTGIFRPLIEQIFRQLQPAGNPGEFYAAIYDEKKQSTSVGVYNLKKFTITPQLEIPGLRLLSNDMWVDAEAGKIYFAYLGHLLRLPWPERRKQ